MYCSDLPNDYNFLLVNYGHPTFPYAHIQLKKATKSIHSHFREEEHPFIHNTLKKDTIGFLILCLQT